VVSNAYTGVGSRETPTEILEMMEYVAYRLGFMGWTLRSGCAPGADSAFENGANEACKSRPDFSPKPELYLPWPDFEGRTEDQVARTHPQKEAFAIAAEHHPAWHGLKQGAKALHARNVHQVLGPDVTAPDFSKYIICWTPDGKGGGGTGQAIRIAQHHGIPVFDLARDDDYTRVTNLVSRN
jgi:hypothetical protein